MNTKKLKFPKKYIYWDLFKLHSPLSLSLSLSFGLKDLFVCFTLFDAIYFCYARFAMFFFHIVFFSLSLLCVNLIVFDDFFAFSLHSFS